MGEMYKGFEIIENESGQLAGSFEAVLDGQYLTDQMPISTHGLQDEKVGWGRSFVRAAIDTYREEHPELAVEPVTTEPVVGEVYKGFEIIENDPDETCDGRLVNGEGFLVSSLAGYLIQPFRRGWKTVGLLVKAIDEYRKENPLVESEPVVESESIDEPARTLFKEGREYKTRSGMRALIYKADRGGEYPIHGAVWFDEFKDWEMYSWKLSGLSLRDDSEDEMDLIPPTPPFTVEVGVYKTRDGCDAIVLDVDADMPGGYVIRNGEAEEITWANMSGQFCDDEEEPNDLMPKESTR